MENNDKVVHIQLDTWHDMGEATDYLHKIEAGDCDNEVNYSSVWYDMAIIYCITTTEEYAKEHKLMEHIVEDLSTSFVGNYFPEYVPNTFGCKYDGEFEGYTPYKEFNQQLIQHFQ